MSIKDKFVGKKALQPFFEKLYRLSLTGMNYGRGAYVELSGELFVMDYVKKNVKNPVVFDVGANDGQYLEYILKYFPDAEIHSFEPSSACFKGLQKYKKQNVHLHNLALSSENHEMTLNFDHEGAPTASVYTHDQEVTIHKSGKTETIHAVTLDSFCESNGIDKIDFLKIDVEGHELDVLKGAEKMLPKIKYIQFEFGPCSVAAKTFLHDFYKLLKDFEIYRILNDGIRKMDYDIMKEVFVTSNYLAILK